MFVWIYGERLKTLSLTSEQWFLSHYRDKDLVKVDFAEAPPPRAILAIEVQAAATITADDFKGIRRFRDPCGEAFASGTVLYEGREAPPFGED